MMSGAEHAGATVLHSCFDKKFEAANFKWEGTCGEDVTKICYDEDGWKMDGTQCSKGCTGVATYAQIDKLHQECEKQAQKEYIKSGGNTDEWDMAMMDGAATQGGAMMETCFDLEFAKKGYAWEGQCKDNTATICWEGGWLMDGTQCECLNVVTSKQLDAIHEICDKAARKEFVKGGGDTMDWDMAMADGAADAGTDMMLSCFVSVFLPPTRAIFYYLFLTHPRSLVLSFSRSLVLSFFFFPRILLFKFHFLHSTGQRI